MAERKVASRKLIRECVCCEGTIYKGDVYYRHRNVYVEYDEFEGKDKVFAGEWLECEGCVIENEQIAEKKRQLRESGTCDHEFTEMHYRLMDGEYYAKEPDYEECLVCGGIV